MRAPRGKLGSPRATRSGAGPAGSRPRPPSRAPSFATPPLLLEGRRFCVHEVQDVCTFPLSTCQANNGNSYLPTHNSTATQDVYVSDTIPCIYGASSRSLSSRSFMSSGKDEQWLEQLFLSTKIQKGPLEQPPLEFSEMPTTRNLTPAF